LARQFGIDEASPERFKAAVMYVLKESSYTYGHVFLTYDQLTEQVYELLEVDELFDEEQVREFLADLLEEKKIFIEEGRLYLRNLYFAEDRLALKIRSLLHQQVEHGFAIADLYRVIGELEEEFQVTYAEQQREALVQALSSPLMILTGGPGTGKTTVIRGICHLFARLHEFSLDPDVYEANDKPFPIRLVAPTGRAAKRMSETTGLPAMTIHRLLGWKGTHFEHNEENPIQGMLLIVDETSMLDILLANKLFQAIPPGMQVILVGDPDQLPSVGPGQVLHHLLQVKEIPRVELTEVFRQAESSSIIRLAHHIKQGQLPEDLLEPLPDRRFFPCRREQVLSVVLQTYENALKRGYTPFDVQVLAPIYKGPAGVDRLNQEIQQLVNPRKEGRKELLWGEQIFRQGDKVLQLVNHPEYPIYNGDMGVIIAVDETAGHDQPVLWVQFDRLEVPYKRSQLGQISLAYACSVHKSQGSEFPIVIFPILHAYRRMLERNLIYTAITRSKSYLILCGEADALRYGISQVRGEMRNSRLKELIVPVD
jgi:exodeoxyribonuclease V alpha subunit